MKIVVYITTLTFTLLLSTFNLVVVAQPTIQWEKSLGGSSSDGASSIAQTTDGGYIVAGASLSNDGDVTLNYGGIDCWVVKLDANGTIQWEKNYGGSGNERVESIIQTIDGGYIFAGFSGSTDGDVTGNNGSTDYWIVKLDTIGTIQWEKNLGGSGSEGANSIYETTDGGYIIAGESDSNDGDVSNNNGNDDYWVVKIDNLGNLLWEKSYGGSSGEVAYAVLPTNDLGYLVIGESISNDGNVSNNNGGRDYWVVKLDSIGNLVWQKNYGGSSFDRGKSVVQTQDGGYVIAGRSGSNDGDVTGHYGGIAVPDYWVIKIDSIGNLIWEKNLGGTFSDIPEEMVATTDGGFVLIGSSGSFDTDVSANYGNWDYWAVKIDSLGNIEWEKNLGGSFADFGYAVAQTTDNGFVVAGQAGSADFDVSSNNGTTDFWVVKLSPVTSVAETENNLTIAVFPNPVNEFLTVNTNSNAGQLLLLDLLGQQILREEVSKKTTVINLIGIAKGTYILKYVTKHELITKKIILQ